MTAGKPSSSHAPKPNYPIQGGHAQRPRPHPSHNETSHEYFKHSSAQRVNTDAVIISALRKEYPELHLTVVPTFPCNLLAYAQAGFAGLAPIDDERDRLIWRQYVPPANRLHGGAGALANGVRFAKYLLDWQGKEYVMYYVDGSDGTDYFGHRSFQYLLSPSVEATDRLILEAGQWNSILHDEIYVYDQGYWQKSKELFESVKKASWDDVILKKHVKDGIINDATTFFDSQDTYERLKVPWKRGVIYYGPPGNGKTISIKAMMHMLYNRTPQVPTLYVKTLANWMGPEASIDEIFSLARSQAPCYLVFEDLDSIVTDEVRSFFLVSLAAIPCWVDNEEVILTCFQNAVDGIQKNDGILMVGSTNHLERLDPGISKRPSRFDRKYEFHNPDEKEREMYMNYWQSKLSDNDDIEFPDKLCPAVAKITKGFSFAYLQEAMVASLLAIARESDGYIERTCLECMEAHDKPEKGGTCDRETVRPFKGLFDWAWIVRQVDDEDKDLDNYVLWRELKKQIRILREELGDDKASRGL